jgi:hypothetical protein
MHHWQGIVQGIRTMYEYIVCTYMCMFTIVKNRFSACVCVFGIFLVSLVEA